MENDEPKGHATVYFLVGVDRDGIPRFDILTPSNLLSGSDGNGIRGRAQGSLLSGFTIHKKVAPMLISELRTDPGLLRFNWHASRPLKVNFKASWTGKCFPGSLFRGQVGSFYLKMIVRLKNL